MQLSFRPTMLILCMMTFFFQNILAQNMTPPVSSHVVFTQSVGFTDITMDYHRPNVKGRKIFDGLIPFDEVWRAGANECTQISFSKEVLIAEQSIPAGKYCIYVTPATDEWMFSLNRIVDSWGTRKYDPEYDVVNFESRPSSLTKRVESLSWTLENVQYASADLTLRWDDVQLAIPIQTATDQEVKRNIQKVLGDNPKGIDYYLASRYLLETNQDLEQAYEYMKQRIALDGNQFGILRYKALLERRLGKNELANETMVLSRDMAKTAGNTHYVRMNEASLREWAEKRMDISGVDLLLKSSAYHDPEDKWNKEGLKISLMESRPGGANRYSDVVMQPGAERFELKQWRGRDILERKMIGEDCALLLNGKSEINKENQDKYRLTCEDSDLYKNYYEYLWGLPMKLSDPGTVIDDNVKLKMFEDEELLEMRVTYEDGVGEDIWYFYFHPEDYRLRGYRFYHDEAANDGEFITVEGEQEINGIKVPAKRNWYTHQGRRYLGSDALMN